MRRRRSAFALAAAPLLAMLIAGPAAAGGPTSALLVVPGEGRTASLYVGSADYQALGVLVGAFGDPQGSTAPPPGATDYGTDDVSGPEITVTWLMHDVNVWRVDRIQLTARGGPLISSQTNLNGGELWDRPAVWSRASDGSALTALLNRLGVGPVRTAPVAAAPAPARPVPVVPAVHDGTGPVAGSGRGPWVWGLSGALLGVLAGLLGGPRVTRAVRRRPAPPGEQPDEVAPPPGSETLSTSGPR